MNYTIITQLKNQDKRVYDWMKYHYREGFDSFILFDDSSEDNTIVEIQRFKNDFSDCYVSINMTDGIGRQHSIDNCSNSNSYLFDTELSDRILRSVNKGLEIVKEINPNSVCVVIDVDEFLLTDENDKIVNVISSIYKENNISNDNVYQICVFNFDVKDDYNLEKGFLTKNIFLRWDYDSMDNHPNYRCRHKSMVIAKRLEKIRFIHYLRGPDIVPTTDIHSVDFRDYRRLRMIHFRKPNQFDADISYVEDPILIKRINKNLLN